MPAEYRSESVAPRDKIDTASVLELTQLSCNVLSMDELMTPEEVARRAKVPLSTVRYWRSQGTGPKFARIGRRIMARTSDVEAWIAAQFEAAS